ncbi:MAG: type II toxin-antitoxin system HicA family toxin [Acidisphaera sp.]|nr:type II toxin-antitoxin system HicA family toxin [Acidisphaera sp.]
MAASYDRRVLELLTNNGCHLVRQGRHPIYYSPISKKNFPVPSGIKSRHTANEILEQAGLPKTF